MEDRGEVETSLKAALVCLLEADSYLLKHDLSERSISHKLAEHLQGVFPEWHVDCEYNRDFDRVKKLDIDISETSPEETEARTVYPDIIVHLRGTDRNLVVIEIKKSNNRDSGEYDLRKLEAFKRDLEYQHAYFVELDVDEVDFGLHYHEAA